MATQKTRHVPHQVKDTVATIAAFRATHYEALALQEVVSKAPGKIAQRATLVLITGAAAGRVAFNLALPEFGRATLDTFPLPLLNSGVWGLGLYLAARNLIAGRHEDEMVMRRDGRGVVPGRRCAGRAQCDKAAKKVESANGTDRAPNNPTIAA